MMNILLCKLFIVFVWGILPYINKWGLVGSNVIVYSALRFMVGFMVLFAIVGFVTIRDNVKINQSRIWIAGVVGILASLSMVAYIWLIKYCKSPSIVTSFILPLSLTITFLIGRCVVNDPIHLIQWVGIILSIVACYCLTVHT